MHQNNGFQSKSDFFFFNRWILKIAGLWLPENKTWYVQLIYKIYALTIFISMYCFFVMTEFISLLYTYSDLNDLIKNLSFCLTDLLATGKVVFWYFNIRKLQRIIQRLEEDQLKYERCEDFDPEEIFYSYKIFGVKATGTFLGFGLLTFFASCVPPILSTLKVLITNDEFKPQPLVYYAWTPFNYDTPKMYLIAQIYQATSLISKVQNVVGLDTLIMNLMNFIAYHFTLIQQAFLTITQRKLQRRISLQNLTPEEHKIMDKEMKEMCKQVQKILGICKELENIQRYLIFFQTMATLFILCTCLYLVSSKPLFSDEFFGEAFYLISMGTQFFLFCWFGNEVTLKADQLSMFIWRSNWIAMSKQFKDSMILTLLILKKPIYFSIGNFGALTLSTFMNIAKTSYSLFALIQQKSE
ncbi:unnamed protein product [Brassicogethes aeneus]|uniref:Odorant receptor n=1 Tax=Brassicogethes aeneus TaxID=1431903 RepID=A0A9P0BBQ1_BRAAE|nr:unnamed protein product [Brassicogethes aeneus]